MVSRRSVLLAAAGLSLTPAAPGIAQEALSNDDRLYVEGRYLPAYLDLKARSEAGDEAARQMLSQFASFLGGTWYTPMIEAAAPDQSGDWRVALLPQWEAGQNASAEAGLAGWAITKQSQHPAETEAFIRWFTTTEEGVAISTAQGNFPTFKPVLFSDEVQNAESEFFGGQQLAPIFLESGEGIPQDYGFGPFMDVVATFGIDAVGQALQNQTGSSQLRV